MGYRGDAGVVHPHREVLHCAAGDSAEKISLALLLGKNLILTPGVYNLNSAIVVPYPDTVVLGIGFPTLIPKTEICR